jgi:transcriptional regulator with XRE-family HTH domain
MCAGGYTLRPMSNSLPESSKLRQLRRRVGCSSRELAHLAGVTQSTVLNAERGRITNQATRKHIESALGVILQRDTYMRVGEARAGVTRAESELEAAHARLEDAQLAHERELEQLQADMASLWDDVPEPESLAA